MPICDDPNAVGYWSLKCDRDKPLATRPMFVCKFITRAKAREVNRLLQQAFETPNDSGCFLLLMESIKLGVVGWKNFNDEHGNPLEFNDENLAEKLTDHEIWDLARYWPNAVTLSEDDLKNSGSPATAEQAGTAKDVQPPAAD